MTPSMVDASIGAGGRMKPASLSKSMIGASLTSFLFTVLTFASGVVLARCLGEAGRGQYGAAYFWAQFLIGFGSLSFFEAAIVRRDRDQPPETYLSSMIAGAALLALAACGLFAAAAAGGLVTIPGVSTASLVSFVAVCVVMSLLSRSMSTVESMRHNFGLLNIERVFSPFIFVLICLAVAVSKTASVETVMAAFVASTLPLFLIRLHRFRAHLLAPLKTVFAAGALRLGARFHVAATLTLVATQLDRLIIVAAWSPERLGHYFVALSVAGAGLAVVSQALGLMLLPMLSGVDGPVRRDRLERLFRYTVLITAAFVALVYLLAPSVVPLVYGAGFAQAAVYAQGLALAMALTPLRAIVLEANRSVARDRPGMEMALASLLVFLAVFAATRFTQAGDLFLAIGLSHLAAVIVGLRGPWKAGELRLARALVPRPGDVSYLAGQLFRYGRDALGGRGRR